MRNWLSWLAILGIWTGLQGQTASAASDGLSRVHLTFLNCAAGPQGTEALKLSVLDLLTHRDVANETGYTLQKTPLGAELDIHLAPGFYNVGVLGDTCSDEVLLPVLKGRDQDALLIGWRGFRGGSTTMVAGTLPLTGYSASIVYYPEDQDGRGRKWFADIPARVDGDAYYATGLLAGTARLRVSTADRSQWLEFKIGEIGESSGQRYIVFNVSEADVKNALRTALPHVFPLKAGLLTLSTPANIGERQGRVKTLSSEYDFYDAQGTAPLLKLVEGSGAYDLKNFTKACLNGRVAWRSGSSDSGSVIMGVPGSWVVAYWSNLSGDRLSEAGTITSSMNVNFGPTC